jgi:hypothetical protein
VQLEEMERVMKGNSHVQEMKKPKDDYELVLKHWMQSQNTNMNGALISLLEKTNETAADMAKEMKNGNQMLAAVFANLFRAP